MGRRRLTGTTREVAIGLGAYGLYLAVRRSVWNDAGRARAAANADRISRLERRLRIDVEPAVQKVATRHTRVTDALNVSYAAGNVALSVGWLIVLHHRGSPHFRRERRAAVLALTGALPVFWAFPTAPPRSRPDFIDTLAERGIDLEQPVLVRFYNPIAAMPSHHVAFAVVTGFGLGRRARTPLRRMLWRAYPLAVTGVVVATANHFVLDAAAGAVLGGLARMAAR
jgi:PAP2 superfamily protein